MARNQLLWGAVLALLGAWTSMPASAQTFRVQCPNGTWLHPATPAASSGRAAIDSMLDGDATRPLPSEANPQIKCQEISGGDGYATMADGHQIYLFAFGPLSGTTDIAAGKAGTELASVFNTPPADPNQLPIVPGSTTQTNVGLTDPQMIMNQGVMFGNAPAPTMQIDEDDEFYLTLSNVGMIMRPDLFEQHTVHFHGYPNAAAIYDGVPDASIAINIAGSFTYYYTAPDAGTYFWHCHITPPEHLQMGMEGQLYVEPRQNHLVNGADPYNALKTYLTYGPNGANGVNALPFYDHKVSFPSENCATDFLCSTPLPAQTTGRTHVAGMRYAYNDGDLSTAYDVEAPIQMMGFDPNFHYVGMTFNPESFQDMKDKYFLLNGRSYPDTINPVALQTEGSDGVSRTSQPMSALVTIDRTGCATGGTCQSRALLRISQLSVTEMVTLATVGVPMHVVGWNARLLRDLAGHNMDYYSNSITMGGGESADVIVDVSDKSQYPDLGSGNSYTFYLYSTNLDHLSNDAENFGGMMTEIVVKY